MKMLYARVAIALGCVLFAASPAQADLLTNPGFESSGSGWGSYGSAGFHDFFGGNGHASFFMDNPGNSGGVFQTGIVGTSGTEYTFSLLDVRIEDNVAANVQFGLEYFAVDDSTKLGETLVVVPLSPTGNGLSFSMSGVSVAGTAFVRPIIKFDNVTSTASGQENLFVFEASLTEVPEPSTAMICTFGMIVFGVCKRRRITG